MKTHEQLLESLETRFIEAMVTCDLTTLQSFMDPEFIYTNETGEQFIGIKNLPILNPEILCVNTVFILDRTISVFNNVAIVNSFEKRSGKYLGIDFKGEYRNTRVWKFNGRNWIIIGAVASIF